MAGDEIVELVGGEFFGAEEVDEEAGVEIAGAGGHDETGGGGESHGGVDGLSVMDGSHAGSGAEVGEDDASVGGGGACDAVKFGHEIGVGEAVEAESAEAGVEIFSGDGEELRDVGKVVVEGGVEAGDLGHGGEGVLESFDEGDLAGEMGEVEGLGEFELGEEVGGDGLVSEEVEAAVDDAVADGGDGGMVGLVGEPCDEMLCGGGVIFGGDGLFNFFAGREGGGGVRRRVRRCVRWHRRGGAGADRRR